ncbi:MAG: Ig-like domain-containing protein [Bacteroidota bacterium]
MPAWTRGSVTVAGTAGDDGSGLSKVTVSTDGGQNWQAVTGVSDWSFQWDTTDIASGLHDVVVRAVDAAGLVTDRAIKTGVDREPPAISMSDSWFQWDTVTLDIQDEHSGVSTSRLEISDPGERWPARIINLDAAQFPMQFKWDRRFGDDTIAPAGSYDVKVFATDEVGNSTIRDGAIKVLVDILPPGPTATSLPAERPSPTPTIFYTPTVVPTHKATQSAVVKTFGATAMPILTATSGSQITSTPRVTPTQNSESVLDRFETIFRPPSVSTETVTITENWSVGETETAPLTSGQGSNILWGATAAAVMGSLTAYALEEKRKREEEKERQAELEREEEERHEKIKAQQTAKLEAKWAQERAWEAAREAEQQQQDARYQASMEARLLSREIEEEEKRVAEQQAIRERKEQEKREKDAKKKAEEQQAAALAASQAVCKAPEQEEPKQKSFWEKSLDWIDNHQTEIALGLGVVVGVGAILLSGGIAAPAVALAWTAGAAAIAAGTAAAGTVALNLHYDRPWNTNLITNLAIAGGVAAVVTGGWFLLQAASTAVGAFCGVHKEACSRVEPILNAIDTGEEYSLTAKLAYQRWRGDEAGAEQTLLDLQLERMDGGTPGNAIASSRPRNG